MLKEKHYTTLNTHTLRLHGVVGPRARGSACKSHPIKATASLVLETASPTVACARLCSFVSAQWLPLFPFAHGAHTPALLPRHSSHPQLPACGVRTSGGARIVALCKATVQCARVDVPLQHCQFAQAFRFCPRASGPATSPTANNKQHIHNNGGGTGDTGTPDAALHALGLHVQSAQRTTHSAQRTSCLRPQARVTFVCLAPA